MNEEVLEGHEVHDDYNLENAIVNAVTPERGNQLDQIYLEGKFE